MRRCARLLFPAVQIAPAQDGIASQQNNYVFKANAELVLTNVVVRDAKTGEFVRGLKQSDFTVSRTESRSRFPRSISRPSRWPRR